MKQRTLVLEKGKKTYSVIIIEKTKGNVEILLIFEQIWTKTFSAVNSIPMVLTTLTE